MNVPHGPERPAFQRRQYEFAAHIRDPKRNPAPGDVEDRRMAIYRDLFFRNVEGLLSTNFPVIRRVLADDHWHALVRDFFARHRSATPLFPEIAQEFLEFLSEERDEQPGDPPFLLELAHYEWVELALAISDADRGASPADPNGDLLSGVPLASPLAWNLTYRFPVHRIGPGFQPEEPDGQPTHLVVYRDRRDRVSFLEINAVTQRLLELMKEDRGLTGLELVTRIAEELRHPQPEVVIQAGRQLLDDLRRRDIVLGTAP
ncbi:MAG: putative DNA-binding domain-containing protein [Chromatiales bacterium]|jgi:hypothetical protein